MLTLARELGQPFGLAQALSHAVQLQYHRREARIVHKLLEEQGTLLTTQEFAFQSARGTMLGSASGKRYWAHQ
jgi:hypothetical protein